MPRIEWRSRAERDLVEIFEYIFEVQPAAAWRIRDAIRQGIELLAAHPGLGRPGRVAGTRELVIARTPYLVAYTFDSRSGVVQILTVIHGARRWPSDL